MDCANSARSADTMPEVHTSSRISPFCLLACFGEDRVPLGGVHSGLIW